MDKKIKIDGGVIICEGCNGNGRIYSTTLITPTHPAGKLIPCYICDGRGIRKPTWTEKITLRSMLKDCPFNELQTWKEY